MHRRALLLLSLTAMLALAGCGQGGVTTLPPESLTKAGYDAAVSHLCLLAADGLREMHMANTVGDWRHYGSRIIRIAQHFDDALAAVKPPASIASEAHSYQKAYEKELTDEKAAVAAARAGHRQELFRAIAKTGRDGIATFPYAKAMGATGCYVP